MGRDRWTTSQDGITATVDRFDRLDVLRILRITNRQMQSWQKAGLVSSSEFFSFADLLQIKKLRDLRADRVGSSVIRKSLEGMKLAAGMANPLVSLKQLLHRQV